MPALELLHHGVFGAAPFGSLLAGILAEHFGAPWIVIITGSFCLAGSLWFKLGLPQLRASIRPIYESMGLLPAIPGDVSATVFESEAAG